MTDRPKQPDDRDQAGDANDVRVARLSNELSDLRIALSEMQERLMRIERHLGLKAQPQESIAKSYPIEPPKTAEVKTPAPVAPPPLVPPIVVEREQPKDTKPAAPSPASTAVPPVIPVLPVRDETGTPPRVPPIAISQPAKAGLESTIAVKWFAWIGAIIIVVGAAFALQLFGADVWSRLSPTAKVLLVAAFGGALVAGGEFALRKVGRFASVGLFSAGLGVLYLDGFATHQFFDPPLLSQGWSFALVAVVTLVGFAITLRTQFLTIGILSLIAGYLAPVLLNFRDDHPIQLLTYFTALLGTGLALSAAAPQAFRSLRYVSLGLHIAFAGIWLAAFGDDYWFITLVFMTLWWAMVLGETTLAAMRRQSAIGNAVATFIATACYVTAGCLILDNAAPAGANWLGLYTAGVAVICIVTAMHFGPGIEALRSRPEFPIDKLSVALLVQSAALIAVAIALHFDDYGRSIGWLAVAVASIELGNRLRSRGLDIFGVVLGSLALLMVATIDRFVSTALSTEVWHSDVAPWYIHIDQWTLLVIAAIVITHYAAHRLRPGGGFWKVAPALAAWVGTFYWIVLCLARTNGLATDASWLIGVAVLLAIHPFNRNTTWLHQSVFLTILTAARWMLIDGFGYRFESSWNAGAMLPFVNGQMLMAVFIAAGLLVSARLWLRSRPQTVDRAGFVNLSLLRQPITLASMLPVAAVIVLFIAFSFEVDRLVSLNVAQTQSASVWPESLLRAFWITMLWSAGGAAVMFLGRANRAFNLMAAGGVFVAFAAFAWLAFETLAKALTDGVVHAPVIVNLQFITGVVCAAAMTAVACLLNAKIDDMRNNDAFETEIRLDRSLKITAICIIGAIGLWLGSLEIARFFHGERMATQMGLSVYWGLYAVAIVAIGFIRRLPAARYVGLAMLGITVVKVLTIDLATVEKIWRVVSLLVTGLLAVGVSIGYVKLSPRLMGAKDESIEKARH